jgi:hypothetical protein
MFLNVKCLLLVFCVLNFAFIVYSEQLIECFCSNKFRLLSETSSTHLNIFMLAELCKIFNFKLKRKLHKQFDEDFFSVQVQFAFWYPIKTYSISLVEVKCDTIKLWSQHKLNEAEHSLRKRFSHPRKEILRKLINFISFGISLKGINRTQDEWHKTN